MSLAICKQVLSMVYTIMFFVTYVNQTAITTPGVRMNNAVRFHSAANDGLQGLPGTIRHDLRVDLAAALKDTKDRGFTIGATATLSPYTPGPEVCSSTSISPWKGDDCSQNSVILFLIKSK